MLELYIQLGNYDCNSAFNLDFIGILSTTINILEHMSSMN